MNFILNPFRVIRDLRLDLENVRRYNVGLAEENRRLRVDLDGLGDRIIGEIIKQGMFVVNYPDPDEQHVFVWSANSAEQLECVVSEFLSEK